LKVAFAIWNKRIAPVFDTAREVLVVDISDGKIVNEFCERLSATSSIQERLDRLRSVGVELLVCGAVSRVVKDQVETQGIKIHAFVSGYIREVIQAWLDNEIDRDAYVMPGCCRRRRAGWRESDLQNGTGGGNRRGRFGPRGRGGVRKP